MRRLAHAASRLFNAKTWHGFGVAGVVFLGVSIGLAQSLDSRLDEDQFLRGLGELGTAEVLEQYISTHPASDAVRLAHYEIARQRITLTDASLSTARRLAAIERILTVRGELISQRPNDERRPQWLADQAADLFFELLPIDASGLTTIVGVPSTAQRERVSRVAQEMYSAASQAENELDRARSIPSSNDRASNKAAVPQRRIQPDETDRQRRIPFLRGVSACLQAQVNLRDASQQKPLFTQAADDLPALTQVLEGVVAIDARQYAALAQWRLGRFDEAEANLAAVTTNQNTPAGELFFARMLGVMIRASKSGPSAALDMLPALESQYTGAGNAYYRLLIADQRFLLRTAIAHEAPPDQRPALMAGAYSAYTDLLNMDFGIPQDALRAAVFAKLSDSTDRNAPIEALPAIVAIAQADQLTRSSDAGNLREAVAMLKHALARTDLDMFERSTARFALARSQYSLGQHQEAAQGFLQLAEESSSDATAERAVELATSIAAELVRDHPQDAQARALFNRSLNVLLSKYPGLPTIDRWRLAAGQLAMEDRRYEAAIEALSSIKQGSDQWPEAQYLTARATARRAAANVEHSEFRSLHEQALASVDRARQSITDAASAPAIDSARAQSLKAMADMLRAMRAEELLSLHQLREAIDSLAGIEHEPAMDRSALAEALRMRIAVYQAMQQPEKAAAEIKRYFDAAPDQALSVIIPLMDSLLSKVQALIDIGQEEQAVKLGRTTLLPVAAIIEPTLSPTTPAAAQQFAVMLRLAEAHRVSGEYARALAIYESLLGVQPDSAALIIGRAECLYHLGGEARLAEAMNAYKRLSAAGVDGGAATYWLSQLRMLQILDAINHNTNQIMPRIERLRQQDSSFGGEQYRRGFDALRQKYTSQ